MIHQADKNDLAHALRLTPKDVRIVGFDVPFKNGRHHFNTSRFIRSDGKMVDVTSVQPVYYATPSGHFRPLYEVASGGNRSITLKLGWEQKMDMGYVRWLTGRCALLGGAVLMPMSRVPVAVAAVSTFYPNADGDASPTSVDGTTINSVGSQTWAAKRDNGNFGFDANASIFSPRLISDTITDRWDRMERAVYLFDTSGIDDGATISDATLSLYGVSKSDNFSQSVTIVLSAPASNTALVAADFDLANWTMTQQNTTDISIASFSTSGYNDFALNATGIGNISLTGISKFGAVLDGDRTDTEPTWSSGAQTYTQTENAENASGTAKAPKLAVTITVAPTFIPRVLNVF